MTLKAVEKNGYDFSAGPQVVTLTGRDVSITVMASGFSEMTAGKPPGTDGSLGHRYY